jgi:hypothetical protein
MPEDLALHEPRAVGDEHVPAAVAHDLAVALHRREATLESLARFVALDAEALAQPLGGHRHALLGERIEDVLAAGNLYGMGRGPCGLLECRRVTC